MLKRFRELQSLQKNIGQFPIVGILGARQVGKTTLSQMLAKSLKMPVTYFDLENPHDLSQLTDPMLALGDMKGLIVLDEVQRMPNLFPILRVLADKEKMKRKFLILGSASPQLLRQASESLAGRIVYHELSGLSLEEVGAKHLNRLWLRGGFPLSYLSASTAGSHIWRQSFIKTFLERDIPQLGILIRSETLRRFWMMLANTHGQTWNASEFGRSFGVADTTVRNYLDLLTHALVVRQLLPWHANISKRQVKAPKVYIKDSGILHALLGIRSESDLQHHPKIGASWEGFIVEEIIKRLQLEREECYYWATHAGAELDLLVMRGRHRIGFEIKRTAAPQVTPSMRGALTDLKLTRLDVIHAGDKTYPLAKNIRAVAASDLLQEAKL